MAQGRFFDGQSSQAILVEVTIESEGLRLSGPHEALWRFRDLRPSALTQTGKTVVIHQGRTQLEVSVPEFLAELKRAWPQAELFRSPFTAWIATPGRFALTIILSLFFLGLAFGFFVPMAGDWIATGLPPSLEAPAGKGLLKQYCRTHTVLPDETARVQVFLDQMELDSGQPLTVTVVQDSSANAFALMGGQIVLLAPILKLCTTPDELAALLAHEAAHIQLKHSARLLGRSLAGYFLISYLFNDQTGLTAAILGNLDTFRSLQFSREMEAEADHWAVESLRQSARWDSRALASLLQKLEHEKPTLTAGLFSTHPATEERIQAILNPRP